MAATPQPVPDPAGPDAALAGDLTCHRVSGAEQRQALALLLSGKVQPNDPAVTQFLQFAAQHHLDLTETWAARRCSVLEQSLLASPSPGRTAMLFFSSLHAGHQVADMAQLLRAAVGGVDPTRANLLQALLDSHQVLEAQALAQAGFTFLATLVYMERGVTPGLFPPRLPRDLESCHWSDAQRERFRQCILASYRDTHDCPALVGLRHIDDIIAGHMSSGSFDPRLWLALCRGDQPAAVLLLNPVPQRQALELVYLGIAPAWRGQGLGKLLVDYALAQAATHHLRQVLLAVDESNTPAVRLYRAARFVPTARKLAYIQQVGASGRDAAAEGGSLNPGSVNRG